VQNFTDTFVQTPPGGAAGTDVTTGASSGNLRFDVQSRWMASALARLGVLVDPRDLVYGIGGWSYGGFTTGAFTTGLHPFNLNGPTVGVGIEREVAPTWTLRAEYRYTHFLPRDVTAAQTQVERRPARQASSRTTTSSRPTASRWTCTPCASASRITSRAAERSNTLGIVLKGASATGSHSRLEGWKYARRMEICSERVAILRDVARKRARPPQDDAEFV